MLRSVLKLICHKLDYAQTNATKIFDIVIQSQGNY